MPGDTGDMLLTIILSSSVLYELIGPLSAKIALMRSGAIPREEIAADEGGKKALSLKPGLSNT